MGLLSIFFSDDATAFPSVDTGIRFLLTIVFIHFLARRKSRREIIAHEERWKGRKRHNRKIWKQKEMMVKMSASSDCLFNVKLLPQHSFLHSEKFGPFLFANTSKQNNPLG